MIATVLEGKPVVSVLVDNIEEDYWFLDLLRKSYSKA